jgi:anti-sigma28 factor (negative regulator of flagellin synthesis)
MIEAMHVSARPQLRLVPSAERVRPHAPPSRERVDELARQVADGSYRVRPRRVAAAMLKTRR